MSVYSHSSLESLPFGKITKWRITFVDPINGHIFCQLLETSVAVKFKRLQQAIELLVNFEKLEKRNGEPIIGELCLAKFSVNGAWCRSQIIDVNQKLQCIEVYYLDYGISETIPFESLRDLPSQFYDIPPFAYECILADIEPVLYNNKWDEHAIELIQKLVLSREVDGVAVRLHKRGIIVIKLYSSPEALITVGDQLIASGFALPKQLKSITGNASGSLINQNTSASGSGSNPAPLIKSPNLNIGFQENILITTIFSPHKFFVHLVHSSDKLIQLMTDIQGVYKNSGNTDLVNDPVVGLQCVTIFSEDDEYYRAEIQKVDKYEAQVLFVDYGNSEFKALSELKSLQKEFIKLPRQAVECRLAGIELVNGSSGEFSYEVCQKFEELTMDKILTMNVLEFSNGVYKVTLFDSCNGQQIDVANELLSSGFPSITGLPKKDYGKAIQSIGYNYKELSVDVNSFFDIVPVNVVDPNHFFCHILQNALEFKKLTETINEFYQSKSLVNQNMIWQETMPCIALFDEDQSWYRASILSSVDKNSLEILFVDFGNTATVSITNLYTIYEEFMKLPMQVFPCSLDVAPKQRTWISEAVEFFQNLVLDKHLGAFVKEKRDQLYSIVLYDTQSSPEINVGQLLLQKGYAVTQLANQSITEFCLPFNTENIYVTAVISSTEVYAQLERVTSELDTLMNDIDGFYSKLKATDMCITTPVVGQYCCAKFTEDNFWYRAIIEELDGNYFGVFYIDYGNKELLTIERIKNLHSRFLAIPKFALPCQVNGSYDSSDLLDKKLKVEFTINLEEITPFKLKLLGTVKEELLSNKSFSSIPAKMFDIAPTSFKPGDDVKMYFLEAVSPESFYCQPTSSENQLNALMQQTANYVKSGKCCLTNITVGCYYLANYSVDGMWYRAQIISKSDLQVEVRFCDYGNIDVIQPSKILDLPFELSTLSQQAVLCTLHGVKLNHDKSTHGTVEMLNNMLSGKELKVTFVSTSNKSLVKVKDIETNQDIADQLIASGIAISSCSDSQQVKNLLSGALNQNYANKQVYESYAHSEDFSSSLQKDTGTTDAPISEELESAILMLPHTNITKGSYECTCYAVESAFKIFCQLSKLSDDIERLMNEIAVVADCSPVLMNPIIGQLCLAKYVVDESWYRGRIIAVDKDVLVEFVDYGNKDSVPLNDIRILPADFATVPQASVGVILYDVCAADINCLSVKKWLEDTFLDYILRVEVVDVVDPNTVTGYVYEIDKSESINDQVYELYALPEGVSSSLQKDTGTTDAPISEELESAILMLPHTNITKGSYECTCYAVESAFKIFCQLSKLSDDIERLMNEIAVVADCSPVLMNPIIGQLCLAKYVVDESWYRGRIIAVDKDVLVEFVDYGNKDSVPLNDIRILPADFATVPQASVGVILYDVCAADINCLSVKKWLEDTFLDYILRVEVVDVVDPNTVTGYVYEIDKSESINDQVYELYALPEGVSSSLQKDTGTTDAPISEELESAILMLPHTNITKGSYECTCYAVESAFKIFCQLSKLSDDIERLMNEIAVVADCSPVLMNPIIGQLCLAKYVVDESWYRGRIIAVDKDVLVEFVDYGNKDSVPLNDIRILPADFATVPQASVGVILYDVYAADINCLSGKKWLEDTFLDYILRVEVVDVVDPNTVTGYVYEIDKSESINDQVYELYALPEGVLSSLQKDTGTTDAPISEELESAIYMLPHTNITKGSYECTCYAVESAFKIFCQLSKLSDDIERLMNEIAVVADCSPVLMNPIIGQLCLAKYVVDESWYRGRIIAVDKDVLVEFVDYGNKDSVPLNDIRILPADFATVPQASVGVILYDVYAADINCLSGKKWLEDTFLDYILRVEVVDVVDPNTVTGYVYEIDKSESINDQVYELYALPNNDFKKHDKLQVSSSKVSEMKV